MFSFDSTEMLLKKKFVDQTPARSLQIEEKINNTQKHM